MPYLLDTNIISHFIKYSQGAVAQRIEEVGEKNVFTSIIVAAELRFGARKKGSLQMTTKIDEALERTRIAKLEPPVDNIYAEIRAVLEERGTLIGGNDMLIAAHALATGSTLVTANTREFSRVPGLEIENWLAWPVGRPRDISEHG